VNGSKTADFAVGPERVVCAVPGLTLQAGGTGVLTLSTFGAAFDYELPLGKDTVKIPASAALSDARVTMNP
jgi:hypothetical protein